MLWRISISKEQLADLNNGKDVVWDGVIHPQVRVELRVVDGAVIQKSGYPSADALAAQAPLPGLAP